MGLLNEHSTGCPITPASRPRQVLDTVAHEIVRFACPQSEDFGQAQPENDPVRGKLAEGWDGQNWQTQRTQKAGIVRPTGLIPC